MSSQGLNPIQLIFSALGNGVRFIENILTGAGSFLQQRAEAFNHDEHPNPPSDSVTLSTPQHEEPAHQMPPVFAELSNWLSSVFDPQIRAQNSTSPPKTGASTNSDGKLIYASDAKRNEGSQPVQPELPPKSSNRAKLHYTSGSERIQE